MAELVAREDVKPMWSAIPKTIELFLQWSRLRVTARWTVAEIPDQPHVYGPKARALQIDVINPVGHDIPIDSITVHCGPHAFVLTVDDLLCATCPEENSIVPARDRCQYWVSQVGLGRELVDAGLTGTSSLSVEVKHSTGRRSTSNRVRVDLEILRLWLWMDAIHPGAASRPARAPLLKTGGTETDVVQRQSAYGRS
jgi:hypothetical protein